MLPCTEEEVVAYFILFLIYTSLSTLFGPSRSPFLTSRRYTVWEWHKRSLRVNTRLQRESAINTIQRRNSKLCPLWNHTCRLRIDTPLRGSSPMDPVSNLELSNFAIMPSNCFFIMSLFYANVPVCASDSH